MWNRRLMYYDADECLALRATDVHALSHCQCPRECVVKLYMCFYAVRVVVKDCDCVKGCVAALSVVKVFVYKDCQRFL